MNDWFEWNGIRCTAYDIHVTEHAPVTVSAERFDTITVPGRSGSLTTTEGEDIYDDITLTENCYISTPRRISEICAWLKGRGTLRLANRPEGYYRARVTNQIPFDQILRGNRSRTFSVQFRCDPYFYINDVPAITLTSSGHTIKNIYGYRSFPIITVTGTGNVTVSVSGIRFSIDGMTTPVTVDTEAMMAYRVEDDGSITNESGKVTLDDEEWPTLAPGSNAITWSGNISSVKVEPNWRCR